ncbi:MAG: hypothetical protein ACRD0O_18335, partial [Acidimicrobiia bacterium]
MRRVMQVVAAVSAAVVVVAGCGSQRSLEEIRAASVGAPEPAGLAADAAFDPRSPAFGEGIPDTGSPTGESPGPGAPVAPAGGDSSPGAGRGSESPAAVSLSAQGSPSRPDQVSSAGRPTGTPTVPSGSGTLPSEPLSPAAGPGGEVRGEIVIGSVGNYSGIPGTFMSPGARAVQAWV